MAMRCWPMAARKRCSASTTGFRSDSGVSTRLPILVGLTHIVRSALTICFDHTTADHLGIALWGAQGGPTLAASWVGRQSGVAAGSHCRPGDCGHDESRRYRTADRSINLGPAVVGGARQAHREATALAGRARRFHGAAHRLCQLLGQRQAQARAAGPVAVPAAVKPLE